MQSKSSALATSYAVVAIGLALASMSGALNGVLTAMTMPVEISGLLVAMAAFALGLTAIIVGGDIRIIVSAGTVAAFIAIAGNQGPLLRYLTFSAVLFSIGVYGVVASRNVVRVLISIELMLNAVNINFVAFSRYVDQQTHILGQIFSIFILTVAAAEAAVGLAIVLAIYRTTASVNMEKFDLLKW